TSEGVIRVITGFTADNRYVYYYHTIKKTIRLIRLEDAKVIANYRLGADATDIRSSPDSEFLAVGGLDGSLVVLIIADARTQHCLKRVHRLPSRVAQTLPNARRQPYNTWRSVAKMAVISAKREADSGSQSDSKTCALC
ncbi:unnamed protein product, partial [Medioppia subpectinata]